MSAVAAVALNDYSSMNTRDNLFPVIAFHVRLLTPGVYPTLLGPKEVRFSVAITAIRIIRAVKVINPYRIMFIIPWIILVQPLYMNFLRLYDWCTCHVVSKQVFDVLINLTALYTDAIGQKPQLTNLNPDLWIGARQQVSDRHPPI